MHARHWAGYEQQVGGSGGVVVGGGGGGDGGKGVVVGRIRTTGLKGNESQKVEEISE